MSRRPALLLAALLLATGCTGARRDGGRVYARDQINPNPTIWMLSEEKEIEIGRQVTRSIEKEYPLYQHPGLQAYVDEIGLRMAAVSDRPNLEYEFKVLDSPIVNAFAAPGGFIYVSRGLLGAIEDEASLAAVLGHEVGHVAARHSALMIQRATTVNIIASVALIFLQGKVSPEVLRGTNVALNLLFLGYTREHEHQSDLLGMKYLYAAGYDPRAEIDVLEALRRESKARPNAFMQFFRTHPYAENRMEHIRGWLGRTYEADTWVGPRVTELARNKDRYQETARPHALWGGQADVRSAVEAFRIGMIRRDAEMVLAVVSKEYHDQDGRDYERFERDIRSLVGTYERIDYKVTGIEADVEEDRAQARFSYELRVVDADRGTAYEERGREYLDLRNEKESEEARWRITASKSTTY